MDSFLFRRFSDFLGLHDKLTEKYLQNGRIVPPAPDKSVYSMTKVKIGGGGGAHGEDSLSGGNAQVMTQPDEEVRKTSFSICTSNETSHLL